MRKTRNKIMTHWSEIPGWCNFEPIYDKWIEHATAHSIIVEIGNSRGRSLGYLLGKLREANKTANVFGIDIGTGSPKQWKLPKDQRYGQMTSTLINNLHSCDLLNDITLIIRDSSKAAFLFKDNSIDFLLIDGDRSYEGVMADLKAYWPKVKIGGYVCGDDYLRHEGVKKAAHEFFNRECNLSDPYSKHCWSVIKTGEGKCADDKS